MFIFIIHSFFILFIFKQFILAYVSVYPSLSLHMYRGMGQPAQQVWEYLWGWMSLSKYGFNIWNLLVEP